MRSLSSNDNLKANTTRSSDALDFGMAVAVGATLGLVLAEFVLFFGLVFGLVEFFLLVAVVWMVLKAVESSASVKRSTGDGT